MTLEIRGPVTPRDLLHSQDMDDESRALLAYAPSHVFLRHSDDRTLYAILIDAPLNRRGLMDVLFAVAPYKAHGPDRFSRVLDNWALFDRAKTSTGSASLMLEHAKSLGFSWQEFERHRDTFVGVLGNEAPRVWPLIAWSQADGRRRWEFDSPDEDLLSAIQAEHPGIRSEELDTLVGLVAIPYLLPELSRTWRAWQPLMKGGKSNYIGPASVPVMALMHRRALLNSLLIRGAEAYAINHSL